MNAMSSNRILVAGAGPVGLVAALALGRAGFRVTLAGPRPDGGDRRTTALMAPALAFLEGLGLIGAVSAQAAPLRAMRIVDATARLVRAPSVTFRASEIGEERFGLNIPNAHLAAVLEEAASGMAEIERHEALVAKWRFGADSAEAVTESGAVLEAALAVAADGRNSAARQAAGIAAASRALPQAALVANISHSRPHCGVSTELHTETGPFTQVPLPGSRSSIVWVVRPETAAELAALDDAELGVRIERRMHSMLGRVTPEPGRQVYPLVTLRPARFAANRAALVGEAAHVFPPIGAQGLNLGMRDVEDLVAVVREHAADPGSAVALAAYDRRRRPDILARSGAVEMLNRSLLSDLLPAQIARSAGLGLLGSFPPLRGFFMREGLKPGGGLSALGAGLKRKPGLN